MNFCIPTMQVKIWGITCVWEATGEPWVYDQQLHLYDHQLYLNIVLEAVASVPGKTVKQNV